MEWGALGYPLLISIPPPIVLKLVIIDLNCRLGALNSTDRGRMVTWVTWAYNVYTAAYSHDKIIMFSN